MTFTFAPALLLLVLLPIAAYIGFPRYGYRRSRDTLSLILRLLILTLLILAISGAQIVRSADKLAVVFLVDVSDSIDPTTQDAQFAYVRSALEEMELNDSAGIVLFGTNAVVERQVNAVRELGNIQSAPLTSNTDLAEAARLGLALFPTDAAKRMIILSDGRPTVGDTEAAAGLAAAADVQIDYLLFSPERLPEVQVTDVDVPSTVSANQSFDLNLTVEAEENTAAQISVFASGEIIYQEDVDLTAGQNRYSLSLESGEAGFRDFQVRVDPAGDDGFYQNNQLSAFSRVIGPSRVLVMANTPEEVLYLVPALEEAGLSVDVRAPNELPIGLAPLAQYDSIIIANIAARFIANARMEAIEAYVRDLGGGLVFIGGPESYGPGGYFQTPIENVLPVETRIRDQQRLPQLTIAYLVDTSGSMGAVGPSGVQNIELAKEAIIRSIAFLQPTDRAGAANFDTAGSWIARIQPVLDRRLLQSLIATLRAGGGTDILAGMNLVARELLVDPSDRKHIILLTDGGASPTGLVELTEEMYEGADVTTSVIAIGAGAAGFLDDMAEAGGGNFYLIDTVEQIPAIFTQETVLATRSYIAEEPFFPTIAANSPIMNGITASPALQGYVATTPKQTATTILRGGNYNDPILASWQYGLGRAVAFTSDATARWGSEWVSWENYTAFWSQTVQWTITESAGNNIETRVVMEGETAKIVVDARDDDGAFLNGIGLDMALVNPDLESEQVALQQVAPGRYEAPFTPDAEGAYILRIAGGAGENAVNQTTGWVMSYSPEYDLRIAPVGADIMEQIALLTDGRELTLEQPRTAFERTTRASPTFSPIWAQLLLLATLLLPFDIAVRRLVVTHSDLIKLWNFVFGTAQVASQETQERMASLRSARQRARQQIEQGTTGASGAETVAALRRRQQDTPDEAPAAKPTAAPISGGKGFAEVRRRQQKARSESPSTAPAKPSTPTTPPPSEGGNEGGNLGSRLLKRRKDRDE